MAATDADALVSRRLALATCTLLTAVGANPVHAVDSGDDWTVDSSWLSYREDNGRVAVSKQLATMTRERDDQRLSVSVVHDAMSGASPSGAIRSNDSVATFTSASSSGGFAAQGSNGDYSLIGFEDRRVQLGVDHERPLNRQLSLKVGGVVSTEDDYDSLGSSVGLTRESADKVHAIDVGLAFTHDTIFRSDTAGTPRPLGDINILESWGEGERNSVDGLLGYTRILNARTIVQGNLSYGVSSGYHSDPYKIISAADENDRIIANFHDSRPGTRQRTALYGKLVHKLADSDDSIQGSYRLYSDSWGIRSHTADLRYHHKLTRRQSLEPHLRLYLQSEADFYYRKLDVNETLDPILPADGYASADYRLDRMTSATAGVKYQFQYNTSTSFRLRTAYIAQRFATADYDRNDAVVIQTSVNFAF